MSGPATSPSPRNDLGPPTSTGREGSLVDTAKALARGPTEGGAGADHLEPTSFRRRCTDAMRTAAARRSSSGSSQTSRLDARADGAQDNADLIAKEQQGE